MFQVVLFFKDKHDYDVKYFNIISDAIECFDQIRREMKRKEYPVTSVILYYNCEKTKKY